MKKLSRLALIGALSFGGFTAVEMIKPATSAQAATVAKAPSDPFNDEWGITDTYILHDFIPWFIDRLAYQVEDRYTSVSPNNRFMMVREIQKEDPTDIVKIFKVEDTGKLTRLKTIEPTYWVDPTDNQKYQTWETYINGNYPSGKYVVIGFIDGQHQRSQYITINK
ncbi:DUF5065 family protein [Bacillus wiedmannii]|uniref:DUF5065 family protein n=1 Tax=Bacillus wiedmannii TaxID=1890302 RepID=UPI000BFBC972|nr:DUF5065 family protein [Bacillus wiedmannii]PHE70543.1 hypothetical protein COF77_25355 [Bacillus wiedmannii]